MTIEDIDTLKTLIGYKVLVTIKTGETLKGIWRTNQVNTATSQLRIVLETENSTVTYPAKIIKSIEKQ